MKRIAVVSSEWNPETPGTGFFSLWALQKMGGIHAEIFKPGTEPNGFDEYLYLNDWDLVEQVKHPAVGWAMDMIIPQWVHGKPLEKITEELRLMDRVFVGLPEAVDYLLVRGIKSAWLPIAADFEFHSPVLDVESDLDWIAVWHNAGNRLELIDYLCAKIPNGHVMYAAGEGYRRNMRRGRCALNRSRLDILNGRPFEVMAMGIPLVTDRTRWLDVLFKENEHYLGYSDLDGLLEKIKWVQTHLDDANKMANRARDEVLKKHTFYHRMLTMFQ